MTTVEDADVTGYAMKLRWTDTRDIAIALDENHPDADVVNLRFTDLWKWVQELPEFDDDPMRSNEKILEAIQMAWLDERT
jgi:FeS assembly protein IscX